MKNTVIGIILFVVGIASPYLIKSLFPAFLYSSIFTTISFWIAWLFILSTPVKSMKYYGWLFWAKIAICIHILITVVSVTYIQLLFYFDSLGSINYWVSRLLGFLCNPIGFILDFFIPKPSLENADGTVSIIIPFSRMILTTFFSIFSYSLMGVILRILKEKKITTACIGFGPLRGPHQ